MTPRTEVEAVAVTATREALLAVAETTRHGRLPVHEGSLDDVVGVLRVRDLFRALRQPPERFHLRTLLRPALFVPEGKHADDLLEEMRSTAQHFAVVVDEFGGTAGIVTLENLLAGLVGGIAEETGPGTLPAAPGVEPDGSLPLDGLTRLDELEEAVGLRPDEADHALAETVGGLVMARLGRVPEVGDEAPVGGRTLRIEARDGLRVAAVRVLPARPDAPTPGALAA